MISEKPLYLINFLGGSGGNFITQLIAMTINGHCNPLVFSNYAGAHNFSLPYCIMNEEYFKSKLHKEPGYKWINIDHLSTNNILMDHVVPNWEELFELYPNCKNAIITIDNPKLSCRIAGNLYFKTICGSNLPLSENTAWQFLVNTNPLFKGFLSPLEVPEEILQKHFESYYENFDEFFHFPFNGTAPKHDQIYQIKYYDILYNPEIVLIQIRQIVGRDLPNGIENEYQKYLDEQKNLVSTRMPWIDDK